MLNKEMVQFFESILEERSDEFRVTDSDLVSPSVFEKKQAKIRRKSSNSCVCVKWARVLGCSAWMKKCM